MSILLSPIADTTLSLWLGRFSSEKPANFGQVITKMFGCLASSVRYLHEQRPVVRHLDIKPQNILIVEGDGEFPHIVLCDFGISTSDDLSVPNQPLTRQYVAPEVFGGSARTSAADIWSLGCVYAEMASIAYGQDNTDWLKLRKEFSGRTGKYYWQDVSGLQDRLALILENAATVTEKTALRALKAMLRRLPAERPDATSLTLVFTPAPCCLTWPNENATYPGPREELSSVEMLIHEDGVDCRTQLHEHGELTAAPTQSLSNAKSWLEQCSHSHEVCNHANRSEAKTLPTRLLEILPDGEESRVRIVNSASIGSRTDSIDYVALSHLWDESHTVLTTGNRPAMETDIPVSTLSDTLNTAITTAQRLGYQYMWTDSLCVIQDNEADKREECANMAAVFRNAALTLMLNSVTDLLEDFSTLPAETSCFAGDTRAWVLQERLLSHRFLHIGQEQMYWECNALKASETFPQGLPLLVWEKAHSKLQSASSHDKLAKLVIDSAAANKTHASTQPHRLRNCQWIRREGDALGDSMEAAKTMLQISATQSFVNDKLGNFPVFTTSTCGDNNTRDSGKDPAGAQNLDSTLASEGDGRKKSIRQEIGCSGQIDQRGSRVDRNGNGIAASANGNGRDESGANANGTGTGRDVNANGNAGRKE
jgi:serine/threonine protein kinase